MSNDAPDAPGGPGSTGRPGQSGGPRLTSRLSRHRPAGRGEQVVAVRPVLVTGPSNFSRAQVPWAVDLAAAWAWRLVLIGGVTYLLYRGLVYFADLSIPLIVAILVTALGAPAVNAMERVGIRRRAGAAIVVLGGLALVVGLLILAGQQVANGANDLANQVSDGLGEIRNWLMTGPFHLTDNQISAYIAKAQANLAAQAKSGKVLSQATHVGSALGHVLAGLFIVLFSTYFFLADGERIWAWLVRLSPRAARTRVDSSGRVAWVSLTQFVRATVIVAVTDALGVMIAASVLRVQFVLAIGLLVFLGAFVPIVGAFIAGTVAVLVAFVDHGIVVALIMFGAVVLVQQVESHVLQPFLMGRFVAIHPLGIILAIAAGILVAGVAGALVAVPLTAAANAVAQHLSSESAVGEDPVDGAPPPGPADDGRVGALGDAPPAEVPADVPAEAAGEAASETGGRARDDVEPGREDD